MGRILAHRQAHRNLPRIEWLDDPGSRLLVIFGRCLRRLLAETDVAGISCRLSAMRYKP
jgi:hypothetical protein